MPARRYTRADGPLCDGMLARLAADPVRARLELEAVDGGADADLARRHGAQVPVIEVGGRVAHEARIRPGTSPARVGRSARIWERRGAPERRREGWGGLHRVRKSFAGAPPALSAPPPALLRSSRG